MEIIHEFSSQYVLYIPVALVIVGAILVFTFGFKSAEQPPFDKLSSEDRKSAGKKRKIKEKKSTANGHVATGEAKSDKSPAKKSPVKEIVEAKVEKKEKKLDNKQVEKIKKNEVPKVKNIEETKNKKNLKKALSEKPVDFDDGNWETVPTKSDKKKRGDQSPAKKEKKSNNKKNETVDKTEIDKIVQEVVNKELQENEKEPAEIEITIESIKVEEQLQIEEPVPVIEEKKEKEKKKKEKKPKKENVEKPVIPVEPKEVAPPEPPKIEKIEPVIEKPESPKVEKVESKSPENKETQASALIFDELGDVWTEAKAPKKTSKKKARRDN